ncbi:MAG: NADH-quinone oxidoreductase subunit D [Deltaproteobacteria bacterium]|nr:MAG: NADH-quinone oxidoreductase subunit D [Deltaproteobacteria bacterium]
MVAERLIEDIRTSRPGVEVKEVPYQQRGYWFDLSAGPEDIEEVARLFDRHGYYIEDVCCVDFKEYLQLVYHFNHWDDPRRVSVRVNLPAEEPVIPSISGVYEGAGWHEREIHEFFGVHFENHPNLSYLFLHEGIDFYPLRKEKVPVPEERKRLLSSLPVSESDDVFFVNMGPQHPSTHGVLRLILKMDGEYIERAEPVLGYLHRMQEKMAENRTYLKYLPNASRLDYVGAMSYNLCYVRAVERLCGIEAPPRAEYVRVIAVELNRIASHLLWLGTYLLDLGAFTPFLYAFDDREQILDLLEGITGSRLTYSYCRFGGLYNDVDEDFIEGVKAFLKRMWKRFKIYNDLVTGNVIFIHRTKDIGAIPKEIARRYGVTGPNLRASGVGYDLRKAEPYGAYRELGVEVATGEKGDALDRYLVRLQEMENSLRVIERAIKELPNGSYRVEVRKLKPPEGDVYFAVEGPRGEVGVYIVSDGSTTPYRLKWRSPSFSNLTCFPEISRGVLIADAVSILGSLDLVIPEMDR